VDLILYKFFVIATKTYQYRLDTRFGVGMTQPEMAGIVMFNQT